MKNHHSKAVLLKPIHQFADGISITTAEIEAIARLIKKYTGIVISSSDKQQVVSRLHKRLQHHNFCSFRDYIGVLTEENCKKEVQFFIDALTTNETYFFREFSQFEFLQKKALPELKRRHRKIRAWSAAASEGQEAYSMAMIMCASLGITPWQVFGSDINEQVLIKARKGIYPLQRLELMPQKLLRDYCLKGKGSKEGYFCISPELKNKVKFEQMNLKDSLPQSIGQFDIILLRNVLIYFDKAEQIKIVKKLLSTLTPKGYFIISTTEHLDANFFGLKQIQKSIYQLRDA